MPTKYPILLASWTPDLLLHMFFLVFVLLSEKEREFWWQRGVNSTVEISVSVGNSCPFFELISTLCFWNREWGRGKKVYLFPGAHNKHESPNGFLNLVLAKWEFFQITLITISLLVLIFGVGYFWNFSRKLREGQSHFKLKAPNICNDFWLKAHWGTTPGSWCNG